MTTTRQQMLHRELKKAIRAAGRAHADVATLCRRTALTMRSLRKLSKEASRASLAGGRVAGFAHMLAAELLQHRDA